MQGAICLDANVLVRFLAKDESTDVTTRLFDHIQEEGLLVYAPAISHFEFAGALAKKLKLKILSLSDIRLAMEHLDKIPLILFWKTELLMQAHTLCVQGLPSFYDATYVATAKLNNIPFITEDLDLKKKAKVFYPNVFTVTEWTNTLH